MKKVAIIFLIILTSCSQNEYEKKLIGIWDNSPYGGTNFVFYQDSVCYYNYFASGRKVKGTWKANNSQIKFHFPGTFDGHRKDMSLDYKILSDSLFIKDLDKKEYTIPPLINTKDYWELLTRPIGLQIDLPTANFKLVRKIKPGAIIYVGFKNGKVNIISGLNKKPIKSENDIKDIVYAQRTMWKESEIDSLSFNLVIDKRVNQEKMIL